MPRQRNSEAPTAGEARPAWWVDLVDRYYRSRPGWRDGNQELAAVIRRYVHAGDRVLELGPGPHGTATTSLLAELAGELVGLDVDGRVRENPRLERALVYDGGRFPLEDESFQAVVADYVLEHLEHPEPTCSEIARVLRPGGVFIFRTPNRCHYVAVLGRMLGDRWAARMRCCGARGEDVYPRYYRLNTRRALQRTLARVGLELVELNMVEKEPSYGAASRLLFYPMLWYERLVNFSDRLAGLRANIIGVARKPLQRPGGATKLAKEAK